jgi:hypothetical protein
MMAITTNNSISVKPRQRRNTRRNGITPPGRKRKKRNTYRLRDSDDKALSGMVRAGSKAVEWLDSDYRGRNRTG